MPLGYDIVRLTNNSVTETVLATFGSTVFFRRSDGNDQEIYFYNGNGQTPTQITDNNRDEGFYTFLENGNQIAWTFYDDNDYELYVYNSSLSLLKHLTENTANGDFKGSSQNNIVYRASDGNDNDLYLFNGTTIIPISKDSDNFDGFLGVFGGTVAYSDYDGSDYEIFIASGGEPYRLT